MPSSRDLLDPNITYRITMTIAVKGYAQDHHGQYRVPPGQTRTFDQAVDEMRRTCAQEMGVHVSQTSVIGCRFSV